MAQFTQLYAGTVTTVIYKHSRYKVIGSNGWKDCSLDWNMNSTPRFSNNWCVNPFPLWRNCICSMGAAVCAQLAHCHQKRLTFTRPTPWSCCDWGACASSERLLCKYNLCANCELFYVFSMMRSLDMCRFVALSPIIGKKTDILAQFFYFGVLRVPN